MTSRLGRTALRVGAAALLFSISGAASAETTAPGSTPASSELFPGPFMRAIERASAKSPDPDAHRMGLIASIVLSPRCFPSDLTEEEYEALMEEFELLPPTQLFAGDERFFTDTLVWTGDVSIGSSGQAARANLTYSFPADGVTWGLSAISSTGPNDLNSRFTTLFGSANLDRGRELVRQSLASWRRFGGLTYQEVADNGESMNQSTTRSAARGDIRIGGRAFGTSSFLAYNAFPSASGLAGVGGGDMCINTSFFISSAYSNSTNNYRYFRNTVAHEHGHGLGNIHTTPCNNTKLMEPQISTAFDMVTIDERRGAGRSYGDRYSGNNSAANAVDFGNLTTPILRSVIERDLSTNGSSGPNGSSADWFRFTLGSAQPVVISAAPTGGSYQNGQQTSGCSPTSPPTINASAAGNLNIELRDAAGTTVLQTAASAGAGSTETLNAGTLAAGTYTVRIFDVGPNSNQTVQLYDMTIRVASASATPLPIAGVNKRVQANTTCWFMGNISSIANEGSISSYSWDLDGDGVFEVANNGQPTFVYVSNGVYNATLRVTTSNGMSADDTITVTVFGATTTVTGVAPNSGNQSAAVPVTITGTNLKNLTAAAMVTVSGSGVSVSGTPVPNTLGTSVSGLVFNISAGAAAGSRNVTVSNADGSGTGVGVFTVVAAPPPLPGGFNLLSPATGTTIGTPAPTLSWSTSSGATGYTVVVADNPGLMTPLWSSTTAATSAPVPLGTLNYKIRYYWGVTASNANGSTASTPAAFNFRTPACLGDANYDKTVDFSDLTVILSNWGNIYTAGESGFGDSNDDDSVNFTDISTSLAEWNNNCP